MRKKKNREWEFDSGDWLLRGSLYRMKRKCGHEKCRCAQGELHESWALSVNVDGRTRLMTLKDEDLPQIEAALARYQEVRRKLEERVQDTMKTLKVWKERKRKSFG